MMQIQEQSKSCAACQRAGGTCGFCAEQQKMLAGKSAYGACKSITEDDTASGASTRRSRSSCSSVKVSPLITTAAVPVCHYCKVAGHVKATCPELLCSNCGVQGHRHVKCPKMRCHYCKKYGHQKSSCYAFDEDREWVKWAKKNRSTLSGGQWKFLQDWEKEAKRVAAKR